MTSSLLSILTNHNQAPKFDWTEAKGNSLSSKKTKNTIQSIAKGHFPAIQMRYEIVFYLQFGDVTIWYLLDQREEGENLYIGSLRSRNRGAFY